MKKMNKKVAASVGLIAVLAAGGTFAYYTQSLSLDNPLSTGHYENQLVETYTPPTDELIPGTTLEKVVGAVNTGDYPVLVRIKMDEKWEKVITDDADETDVIELISLSSISDYYVFEILASGYGGTPYVTGQQIDHDVDGETISGDVDGLVEGDGSVVRKHLTDEVSENSTWVDGGDGYWYYNGVLDANGGETGALIDYITLASNIDLGVYVQEDYYYVGTSQPDADSTDWIKYWVERDDNGWVTDIVLDEDDGSIGDLNDDGLINAIDMAEYLSDDLYDEDGSKRTDDEGNVYNLYRKNESLLDEEYTGYADATYTLLVTSEFVQATSDAVEAAWSTSTTEFNVTYMKELINISADSDGIYSTGSASADSGSEDDNTEETEAEADVATD